MARVLTAAVQIPTNELSHPHEAVLADALFTSTVQPSDCPGPEQVRRAVAATLLRFGSSVCAGEVATEFGDHPDTAAARMTWALATIRGMCRAGVDIAHEEPTGRDDLGVALAAVGFVTAAS